MRIDKELLKIAQVAKAHKQLKKAKNATVRLIALKPTMVVGCTLVACRFFPATSMLVGGWTVSNIIADKVFKKNDVIASTFKQAYDNLQNSINEAMEARKKATN